MSVYSVTGQIRASWLALGDYSGVMGAPVAFQVSYGGGAVSQEFENGWLVYHPTYLIHRVEEGVISGFYWSQGGPSGTLGFPISSPRIDSDGREYQVFVNGTVVINNVGLPEIVAGSN
ncbi:MAG: hypothetical protein KF916_06225 [Microbacteriaceae bacterium]|nr:hypothetical protein [Microbacteriaceae bacterium]